MAKILPGELFITLYVNGASNNRWAVNGGKTPIIIEKGHLIKAGVIDVLVESDDVNTEFKNNRWHVVEGADNIVYLKDDGFRNQTFGGTVLKVFKVVKQTDILNTSGAVIGSIPAGTEIGIQDGDAGNGMKHLIAVNAYDKKDGKGWRFLNETTYTYGFVNIQQGHGLKMYNSEKAIETPHSAVQNEVSWTDIATVQEGKLEQSEAILRGSGSANTKEELIENIKHYFAYVDLEGETLGDPSLYFMNADIYATIRQALLDAGLTSTESAFSAERAYFINL